MSGLSDEGCTRASADGLCADAGMAEGSALATGAEEDPSATSKLFCLRRAGAEGSGCSVPREWPAAAESTQIGRWEFMRTSSRAQGCTGDRNRRSSAGYERMKRRCGSGVGR